MFCWSLQSSTKDSQQRSQTQGLNFGFLPTMPIYITVKPPKWFCTVIFLENQTHQVHREDGFPSCAPITTATGTARWRFPRTLLRGSRWMHGPWKPVGVSQFPTSTSARPCNRKGYANKNNFNCLFFLFFSFLFIIFHTLNACISWILGMNYNDSFMSMLKPG